MQEIKIEVDENIIKEEKIDAPETISYEEKLRLMNAIAKPIASKKLTKKIYKCIKKGKLFHIHSCVITSTFPEYKYNIIYNMCNIT